MRELTSVGVHECAQSRVQEWSVLVDVRVLTIRWMDKPHHPRTVTAESYLNMLCTEVWPEVAQEAGRGCWWFEQDGASVHCTDDILAFLNNKFRRRGVSRHGEHGWPPSSLD